MVNSSLFIGLYFLNSGKSWTKCYSCIICWFSMLILREQSFCFKSQIRFFFPDICITKTAASVQVRLTVIHKVMQTTYKGVHVKKITYQGVRLSMHCKINGFCRQKWLLLGSQRSSPAVKNTLMYILSIHKSWHVRGLQQHSTGKSTQQDDISL